MWLCQLVSCKEVSVTRFKLLIAFKFTAVSDCDIEQRFVLGTSFNFRGEVANQHAADNSAVNGVFAVEMGCCSVADEELGSVGVGA